MIVISIFMAIIVDHISVLFAHIKQFCRSIYHSHSFHVIKKLANEETCQRNSKPYLTRGNSKNAQVNYLPFGHSTCDYGSNLNRWAWGSRKLCSLGSDLGTSQSPLTKENCNESEFKNKKDKNWNVYKLVLFHLSRTFYSLLFTLYLPRRMDI